MLPLKSIVPFFCFLVLSLQYSCHLEKLTPENNSDADFTVDLSNNDGFAPCKAQFENNSSNGILFDWDFGDGGAHSSLPNPLHQYLKPGDYLVTLTISDAAGVKTSLTKPVTIKTRTFKVLIDNFNTFEVNDVTETSKGNFWVIGTGLENTSDWMAYLLKADNNGVKTDVTHFAAVTIGVTALEIIDDLATFFGTKYSSDLPNGPFVNGFTPPDLYITAYYGDEAEYMVDAVKTVAGDYTFIANSSNGVYIYRSGNFPTPGWSAHVGPNGTLGNDLIQSSDGGFVVSGTLYDNPTGQQRLYLFKLNANGAVQWTYNSYLSNVFLWDVAQTTDGSFIVCGGSTVLKIGSNGTKIWEKSFINEGAFVAIAPSLDNGLVMAGANNNDIALLKLDQNGNKVWNRAYNAGKFIEEARAIHPTSDCGFIVLGACSDAFGYVPYLIKTDANGQVQ